MYSASCSASASSVWPPSPSRLDLLLGLVGGLAVGGAHARQVDAELLGGAQQVVVLVAHLDAGALLGAHVHVERQRLHLLQEHLEGLRDGGLGDVLALDDRLVGLHAADRVVGLDREHLLEGVRRAVCLERPHLHLAEALAAELRLAAQRLLGDERVGARAPRVDLVVHEVQQLQDVHVADGDRAPRTARRCGRCRAVTLPSSGRPARSTCRCRSRCPRSLPCSSCQRTSASSTSSTVAPSKTGVATFTRPPFSWTVLVGVRAVVVPAVAGDPPEVRLQDLAEVHPARHAERVEDHVDRRAVLEVRHVGLGHDLRDHALVAVAAGELVALGDLALLGDVHAHELVDARRQVVVVRRG